MNRKRFSAVAATGVLSLGLVLGAPTTAQAAVKAKDVPSKANIVKVYPTLKKGNFATDTSKRAGVPAKKCGTNRVVKVRSSRARTGVHSSGLAVVTGVVEFKSKSAAKSAMKKYKKYVRSCKTFKLHGIRVKLTKNKAPRVGQDRLAMTAVTTVAGTKGYASSVIIRHGKRVATVATSDSSKVSKAKVNRLAKVAAKKMR